MELETNKQTTLDGTQRSATGAATMPYGKLLCKFIFAYLKKMHFVYKLWNKLVIN